MKKGKKKEMKTEQIVTELKTKMFWFQNKNCFLLLNYKSHKQNQKYYLFENVVIKTIGLFKRL